MYISFGEDREIFSNLKHKLENLTVVNQTAAGKHAIELVK